MTQRRLSEESRPLQSIIMEKNEMINAKPNWNIFIRLYKIGSETHKHIEKEAWTECGIPEESTRRANEIIKSIIWQTKKKFVIKNQKTIQKRKHNDN